MVRILWPTSLDEFLLQSIFLGSAVSTESESCWIFMLRKPHPASHGINDLLVSMNSCVGVLLPAATVAAVVAAGAGIEGLLVWDGLRAAAALVANALAAIAEAIWEALSSIIHE